MIAAFISTAATQLGRFYPGVSPYGQWYDDTYGGGKGVYDNGQFCAMGLSWAADRAGIPTDVFPPHAYTPSGAAWFRARGQFTKGVAGIRRGDIWYSSCAGLGRISHVGIVESINKDGSFNTLEFNTAGTYEGDQRNGRMVARKRRNTACSLGGYARPAYPDTAGVLRPGTGSTFTPNPSEEDDMSAAAEQQIAEIHRLLGAGQALTAIPETRPDLTLAGRVADIHGAIGAGNGAGMAANQSVLAHVRGIKTDTWDVRLALTNTLPILIAAAKASNDPVQRDAAEVAQRVLDGMAERLKG